MSTLEVISRLCDVTNTLADVVKKQQKVIEQSKVEEDVKKELREQVKETENELDVIEYILRPIHNTGENTERLSVYDVDVIACMRMEVEATSEKDAEEKAKQEYVNFTHISPKIVQARKRGEQPSDD